MKAIINRKVYDTEKAQEVAHYSSPDNPGDFRSYEETLYLTPKGAWFLVGEGGPMTKYARPAVGGGTCGGSGMNVLTSEEALQWLEDHQKISEIEEYFGTEIEEG